MRFGQCEEVCVQNLKQTKKLEAKSMERFCDIFKSVKVEEKMNELFLFRGTKGESAKSIAEGGFKPELCGGLYGAGTYCADYSCKSMQYTLPTDGGERVFIVCVGSLWGMRTTPARLYKSTRSPREVKGHRFDSVFAQEGKGNQKQQEHKEYVTYSADQVYPESLV